MPDAEVGGVILSARGRWTIVAHPDDDLFFINPGVRLAITSMAPTIGVVLTAAEGDGRNVDTRDPDRGRTPPDHAGYSTARHVGLRRAYARMADLPADSAWRQEAVTLAAGLVVERDTLEAAPHVMLYFVNLAHRQGAHLRALMPADWDHRCALSHIAGYRARRLHVRSVRRRVVGALL